MTDSEMTNYIQENPNSPEGHAYRLGRKTMNQELSGAIEKMRYLKVEPKAVYQART